MYSGINNENGSFFDTDGMMTTIYGYSRGAGVTEEVIPDRIEVITKNTFWYHDELTSITFPESMTRIDAGAFEFCTGLKTLKLPLNITLGGRAFGGCTGLTSVEFSEYCNIAGGAFAGCVNLQEFRPAPDTHLRAEGAVLFDDSKEKPTLLCAPAAKGEYIVPDGTGKVAAQAFAECQGLTRVVLPDSVESIGEKAFLNCTDLEEVVLPAGLKSIAKSVFANCRNLKRVNLPESVKKIGDDAFTGCGSLETLHLPSKLGEIGESAFLECRRLTLDTPLQSSLKKLGANAFAGCERLTSLIMGAKKKAELGNGVFTGCKALREVQVLAQEVKLHTKSCEDWEGALSMPYVDIGSLPTACKQNAVLGFVLLDLAEQAAETQPAKKGKKTAVGIPETLREDYCKYIKGQKKKLYPLAVRHEELLYFMFAGKMLAHKDIDLLLEECDKQSNPTAKAAVLDYAGKNLPSVDPTKTFRL